MKELPQFLNLMLANPPSAGKGVHSWLFCTARQLHAHLPAGQIVAVLENHVAGCGRTVPLTEIVNAVQNSLPCAWSPNAKSLNGKAKTPTVPQSKWPAINQTARTTILQNGCNLTKLVGMSKISFAENTPQTEDIIDRLFPGNPLLCCGNPSCFLM